jgi:Mn-containing catalase
MESNERIVRIVRIDRLATELPPPSDPDPNGAAAVQELLGGRFGEMSTFLNYTFQSFNFRGRQGARPFYDLVANIAAEEFGHVELGTATTSSRFSPSDYQELAAVFNGQHPETGEELVVVDEAPEGVPPNDLPPQPAVFAPDYAPEEIAQIATKLRQAAGLPKEPTGIVANGAGKPTRSARKPARKTSGTTRKK